MSKQMLGIDTQGRIVDAREAAYSDAIRALAKYKFWMFGYYSASWVKYNKLLKGTPYHQGNPFRVFVRLAVIERGELHNARPHEIHEGNKAALQHNAIYPSKSELADDIYTPDPDDLHAVVNYDEDLTEDNTPSSVIAPTTRKEQQHETS